jgi:putative nucleotidyltransferase with HDIG domain
MITIQRLMDMIGELSPLSPTGPKLAQVVADQNSTVDDIASVIRYDQALTLDILKYANSVMSSSARTIATIKDAVVRLGGARILERVVARHVKGIMQSELASYGYSEKDLWRHSVAAAVATEQIGSLTKSKTAGLSFTAALLHDIGKLILGRAAPFNDMESVFRMIAAEIPPVTCEQAERSVLGFSHADIGADIALSWQLPATIVEAIRHHHSTNYTEEPVTDAVKAANIVARTIGEGIGNEGMSLAVDADLGKRLGLSRDQFETVCANSSRRLSTVLSMFEM